MRKLIYAINLSVDCCCNHTKLSGGEEVHEYFTALMQDVDLLVYGRKTYELMVPYWPDVAKNRSGQTKATNDFAQTFDAIPRLVFSRSLTGVEDKNTRLTQADLRDEINRLKKEPGKNILAGGVDLPSQLIELGLVDEYCFVVQPTLAGEGRRLNSLNLAEGIALKLVDTTIFGPGRVALRYRKH